MPPQRRRLSHRTMQRNEAYRQIHFRHCGFFCPSLTVQLVAVKVWLRRHELPLLSRELSCFLDPHMNKGRKITNKMHVCFTGSLIIFGCVLQKRYGLPCREQREAVPSFLEEIRKGTTSFIQTVTMWSFVTSKYVFNQYTYDYLLNTSKYIFYCFSN